MRVFLSFCLILFPAFARASQEDKPADLPSDTEIKLVMAQARQAFEQYKSVVPHAEQLLGKEPFEPDRLLLEHWEKTAKTIGPNPQGFNSEAGLDVLVDLDDAARNTALCSDQASTAVLNDISNLHSQKSQLLLELHQSCLGASKQLFSASENANALYTRYVTWQRQSSGKAAEALAQCNEALQNSKKRQP